VDLSELISQFYASPETLAKFQSVPSVPAPFDELLDHNHHMTVTVERFHGDLVNVIVHRSRSVCESGESVWHSDPAMTAAQRLVTAKSTVSYSREITLATQGSGDVVQYGIVRLNPAMLKREVWLEIAGGKIPLGRVLIEHNVLRSVQLCKLWKVESGIALSQFLGTDVGEIVYGRTALINCDGKPAIELLEIVCDSTIGGH
jgi:chorismate-pyruvate lyase